MAPHVEQPSQEQQGIPSSSRILNTLNTLFEDLVEFPLAAELDGTRSPVHPREGRRRRSARARALDFGFGFGFGFGGELAVTGSIL